MKRVQLWVVDEDGTDRVRAVSVEEVSDTETEERLEDLLVSAPKSLLDGITLIGRQLPTDGGPVDLVGVDESGRLVVLELKRGTLTRDAVAQVLDYASDLARLEVDDFCRFIEQHSGRGGSDALEDFADWYHREYPNSDSVLAEPPRMVLVGVGADARAMRVVDFLAEGGIDIQLLTFHAFRKDGQLMLARQVETTRPTRRSGSGGHTKEENLKALLTLAESRGSRDLLLEVADFLDARMPCYRWPGKTAFSFSLQGRTEEGKPSLHSYVTLWVDQNRRRAVVVTLPPRAEEVAPDGVATFLEHVPSARRTPSSWMALEAQIEGANWSAVKAPLGDLIDAVVEGWRRNEADSDEELSDIVEDEQRG